jgi:hypothetical protein
MVKTAAEKCKEYKERLKNKGLYEAFKAKDKERNRQNRKNLKSKLTVKELQQQRVRNNERQKRCREAKLKKAKDSQKAKQYESEAAAARSPAYKCCQSFGKAYKKVRDALPKSARKVRAVVSRLAAEEKSNTPMKKTHKGEGAIEDEKLITNFYCRDEVSRVAPGKKDFVIVRNSNGKKEKLQKRNLVTTVKEAYHLFKTQYPAV